jgi:hypothetical protein
MNSLPIVRQAKRLHAQIRAQLKQVFAPSFLPLGILWPTCRVEPQLPSDPLQQRHGHGSVGQQALAGEAQQAQLHRDAQAIGVAAPLTDQRQVGFAEGVVPDEFVLGIGQSQEAVALGGGEDRTTGHAVSFFLKTFVYEKLTKATGAAREIKALRFSKIVLEILFLIAYNLNEFR